MKFQIERQLCPPSTRSLPTIKKNIGKIFALLTKKILARASEKYLDFPGKYDFQSVLKLLSTSLFEVQFSDIVCFLKIGYSFQKIFQLHRPTKFDLFFCTLDKTDKSYQILGR